MAVMYILMGLGVMLLVPLVSVFLFLIGFGGLINGVSKMEVEDSDVE